MIKRKRLFPDLTIAQLEDQCNAFADALRLAAMDKLIEKMVSGSANDSLRDSLDVAIEDQVEEWMERSSQYDDVAKEAIAIIATKRTSSGELLN